MLACMVTACASPKVMVFNALMMVVWTVQGVSKMDGAAGTYWHLGRKAATIIAPDTPSSLLLKSASVMSAFMATAC